MSIFDALRRDADLRRRRGARNGDGDGDVDAVGDAVVEREEGSDAAGAPPPFDARDASNASAAAAAAAAAASAALVARCAPPKMLATLRPALTVASSSRTRFCSLSHFSRACVRVAPTRAVRVRRGCGVSAA